MNIVKLSIVNLVKRKTQKNQEVFYALIRQGVLISSNQRAKRLLYLVKYATYSSRTPIRNPLLQTIKTWKD